MHALTRGLAVSPLTAPSEPNGSGSTLQPEPEHALRVAQGDGGRSNSRTLRPARPTNALISTRQRAPVTRHSRPIATARRLGPTSAARPARLTLRSVYDASGLRRLGTEQCQRGRRAVRPRRAEDGSVTVLVLVLLTFGGVAAAAHGMSSEATSGGQEL